MSPRECISEFRVRYAETDQMGVVYHANYLVWCEIGRTDFIRMIGESYAQLEARGVLLAVSEATVRYHAPARYDDAIRVRTTLRAVGSRGLTFAYRIERQSDNMLLVSATTSLVAIARGGRITMLPADVRSWMDHLETD